MKRRLIEFSLFCGLVFFLSGQSAAKQAKVLGATPADTTDSPSYVRNEIIVKFRAGVADSTDNHLGDAPAMWPGSLQQLNEKYKLVKIQPLARGFSKTRQLIKDLERKDKFQLNAREKHILQRARRAPRGAVVPNLGGIYKMRFDLDVNDSLQKILAAYRSNPNVEYAELNHIVRALSAPDDPYYDVQWALNNTGQPYPVSGGTTDSGTPDADIDAPEAWDIYTGSSDIIVAVIDTGVDYEHRDLIANMWTDQNGKFGYDFVNDDDDPMDDFGHGTHCAGIIASRTNNSLDTAGVCWNARIMAVKYLDAAGYGNESDAVSSIYYAVDNGADVLSNSWGGGPYSESIELAINYAYSNGAIVVAGAGNDNSNAPVYPAYYNHVISVAATNSDDQKASFSNYGEWVDIAAPGVDILSLRAQNTDMYVGAVNYTPGDRFIPFGNPDATMYIASGTSMACPYVSGACALMLSVNPALTIDEGTAILVNTVDPIADGICYSDGRLNLLGALTEAIHSKSKGHIAFSNNSYSCDSNAGVFLSDGDLSGEGTHAVNITSSGGDAETIIMIEESPPIGAFTGTIHIAAGAPNTGNGILQVSSGDIIYVTYYDANDGTGNPATVTDTSTIDCVPPVISNVQVDVRTSTLIVTFTSNEPTSGKVSCGLSCGGPYNLEGEYSGLRTSHTIELSPLLPLTTYYFIITAVDAAGNQVIDSNSGSCYSFTTTGPGNLYVPGQYATIQEAVDRAWPGSVIRVADGTYMGQGNRDIDFYGKAITVRSENGPVNCIIDCQGNFAEMHRGFFFHTGETQNSVLDGFTITHGYAPIESGGGGICCTGASPTINNCIIINNQGGGYGGGGIGCFEDSYPDINNCIISGNTAMLNGGFTCYSSDPVIRNCIFTENGNTAFFGTESSPVFRNCLFADNFSEYGGAAVYFIGFAGPPGTSGDPTEPSFYNCTFTGNSANLRGGGMYLYRNCHATVSDCIFWGNTAPQGHEIYLSAVTPSSTMVISYSDIQSAAGGIYVGSGSSITYGPGVIYSDSRFVGGPQGEYYLSQIAAGQAVNSPCVDAGSNTAVNLSMNYKTTRTDQGHDCSTADMGYHYPADISVGIDLNRDAFIDFIDYTLFADGWRQPSNLCDPNSGDITKDGQVDINDLALLVENWLTCFVTAAFSPEPADQAVIMSRNAILQWSPGKNVASHDIYFGTDFYEVENAGTNSSGVYMGNQYADYWDTNNYNPDELDINMTYYWRIDEIAAGCEVKGAVWSFRTPPLPSQASNPSPNNGAIDVDRTALLGWTADSFTTSHDVYFGITNPPPFRGNQTGTIYDTGLMDADTIYYWRIDEKNVCGTTTGVLWNFETGFSSEANDVNIVAWWKFDEGTGTVAYDSRGVNDGNLINGPAWTSGIINGGLSFDGINDYVLIPYNSSLNVSEFFTLAFWIYVDANVLPFGAVISKDGDYETGGAYNVYVGYGNVRTVCFTDKAMAPELITEPNSLSPGAWNHVVVTFNDSASPQARIYINGVEKISGSQPAPSVLVTYLSIGRCGSSTDPSYLNSKLDDVRIYNRDLSAEQVWQLYQSGL